MRAKITLLLAVFVQVVIGFLGFAENDANSLSNRKVDMHAISECVQYKTISGKNYRKKNEYGEFHVDYGDAALEVFHTLSLSDMKAIEYLEECTRTLDSRLFGIGLRCL